MAALLLLAPAATAAWSGYGSTEPDTPQDVRDGFLALEPDTSPEDARRTIYFNVVVKTAPAGDRARLNPNVALGGRLMPPTHVEASAIFGVWKDCNADGFVGAASGAWLTYPSALLPDERICPLGGSYHRNGWVRELVWIRNHRDTSANGDGSPMGVQEPHVIVDKDAGVWGDFGRPGETPRVACETLVMERGTLFRTGGILGFADCQAQYALTGSLSALDPDGSRGLAFDDPQRPERDCGHPLNRPVGIWRDPYRCPGEPGGVLEYESPPAFTAWSCDGSAALSVRDPTAPPGGRGALGSVEGASAFGITVPRIYLEDADGDLVALAAPAPAVNDPSQGHVAAVDLAARQAAGGCMWTGPAYLVVPWLNSVRVESYIPRNPNWPERDATTDPVGGKRQSDFTFSFGNVSTRTMQSRYGATGWIWNLGGQSDPVAPILRQRLGAAPEQDAGIYLVGDAMGPSPTEATSSYGGRTGGWNTYGPAYAPPGYLGVVRSDASPAAASWFTFYARVGAATTSLVPVTTGGTYGSESCGIATTGIVNGWSCAPGTWWRSALGASTLPRGTYGASPGTSYQFRDIDCLDGQVARDVPLYASGAAYGEEACPTMTFDPST